jgi:hypothetical protein
VSTTCGGRCRSNWSTRLLRCSENLAAGKTLVPWSRFVTKHDVRFDPAVEVPNTLMIECLNPVPRAGFFRFTR